MRAYDLILKKRNGLELSGAEIEHIISGYVNGSIPDYQMSAFAMALYFRGMTDQETLFLTEAMVNSGETLNLNAIAGVKVDKHSTGGVGDTTTLILAPLVAAAGVPVVKLSGRGLGHTGGTLDKLESIPGFSVAMTVEELIETVNQLGVAVASQSGNLVPADKKFYALRDVTATVDSIPLIASSIMSKKLAAGADAIVLDVKCGSGAFLKDKEQAFALARSMVAIGRGAGRKTVALVTAMDQPLGRAVGNALEIEEAIKTLRGEGPPDLVELCLALGGWMLFLAGKTADYEEGKAILEEKLSNKEALNKFKALIRRCKGDAAVIEDLSILPHTENTIVVKAGVDGYISSLNAEIIGSAAMALGAGRENKDTLIDPAVGITLDKKIGDRVRKEDKLASLHAREDERGPVVQQAADAVRGAYEFDKEPVEKPKLLLGLVDR